MNMDEITARAQMLIHRPASEVFDAFVHPEKMGEFWFARRDDGLREGESVTWFVGNAPDAPGIEVCTRTLERPKELVIDWGHGDARTTVRWTFEERGTGTTFLRIEERGFSGDVEAVTARALDSTGGFNQVIVAAKAFLEHGAKINVVADHA